MVEKVKKLIIHLNHVKKSFQRFLVQVNIMDVLLDFLIEEIFLIY